MTDNLPPPPPFADELRPKETSVRTWDLVVKVDGFLDGGLVDWPANIAEQIIAGIEVLQKQKGLKLEVVESYCNMDEDGFYLHVIVQHVPRFVKLAS